MSCSALRVDNIAFLLEKTYQTNQIVLIIRGLKLDNGVLAVMQPYVFPYIGYFNLMNCASHFVIYDDVNFIKRGWVNRNRILNNGSPVTFSIPLSNSSQNSVINEIKTANLEHFRKKFLRSLEHAYAKATYFDAGYGYAASVLGSEKNTISDIAKFSITYVADMLEIDCTILEASKHFSDTKGMERSERLINITKRLNCGTYVNSINGRYLYEKKQFKANDIDLRFIEPNLVPYKQTNAAEFVPALSIIDLMMNQSVDELKNHLCSYELT